MEQIKVTNTNATVTMLELPVRNISDFVAISRDENDPFGHNRSSIVVDRNQKFPHFYSHKT